MRRVALACMVATALGACSGARESNPTGTIALTKAFTMTGSGDTVDVMRGGYPHIAPGGKYLVLPVASTRGSLAVFTADGRLDHVFAPIGQGPGELNSFQGRAAISGIGFGPGDSLWIEDSNNMRVSIFSPVPFARFARSFTAPRMLNYFDVTSVGLLTSPFLSAPTAVGRKQPPRGTGTRFP